MSGDDSSRPLHEVDPELDELLNDAAKDFAPPPAAKPAAAAAASSQAKNMSNLETEMKKMLGSEADQLGDLLANEFQKAMREAGNDFGGAGEASAANDDFFAKTMDELTRNMENLTSGAAGGAVPAFNDDMFKEMLSGMSEADGGNLDDIVQDFISTLLDKEILYPSLKELNDKFPDWLSKNQPSLSAAEFERFSKQAKVVAKMCQEYESQSSTASSAASSGAAGSSSSSAAAGADRESMDRLVGLMHEMRELGNPPEELMKSIQGDGASSLDPNQCPMM